MIIWENEYQNPHITVLSFKKQVPILTGIMSEEGVLMAYFIKERLDLLSSNNIKYDIFKHTQ